MATRRERVVLELDDQFTTGMARAAAATALLDKELDSLSKDAVQSSQATRSARKDVDDLGASARRSEKDIDKLSGRLRLLAEASAILGPSLIPVGGVGVAAVSGLASQLGFAAAGAGVAVLAFQGLGDALKAVNKAALEPTAENLAAARAELSRLSPEAASFVEKLAGLKGGFEDLRDLAAAGLFPGLSRGLDGLESALPRVQAIISAISTELGDIAGDSGESLGSARWAPFLDFVAEEAPEALRDLSAALGNTAHALAGLWMSTDPLNDDFSQWLVDATANLDKWANNLGQTEGFAEFLAYVEDTGPQVAATFGALANAALQIVEAAAPLGGPVLKGLEAAADVIAAIADSDLGTPIFAAVGALSLFNRTMAVTERLTQRTASNLAVARDRAAGFNRGGLGKAGGIAAGAALVGSGVADSVGLGNAASLATLGALLGGGPGAAAGGLIGLTQDFAKGNDQVTDSIVRMNAALQAGDLDQYNASVSDLKDRLRDINTTSGIGDFFDDFKNYGQFIAKNPLNIFKPDSQRDQIEGPLKFADALSDVRNAVSDAAGAARLLDSGLKVTTESLDLAAQTADGFADSLIHVDEVLSKRSAKRDYQAAIDDLTQSLKKNGRTFDINTEKGRANQQALDNIAGSAIAFAKTIEDPLKRNSFLVGARKAFIDAATEAGVARGAARRLATQLGLIDQLKVKPTIDVDVEKAKQKVGGLLAFINQSKATIRVGVTGPGAKATPNEKKNPLGSLLGVSADGSTVPKTGMPYADRHLYMLADGEEVISNRHGQADRNRGLLKAINAGRLADGGTAGRMQKPLFDGEGPRYYKRAYKHGKPFAIDGPSHWDWPYQTGLKTKANAAAFAKWIELNDVPFDPSARIVDYDMRGFWKKTRGKGWQKGSHFPDTYKTPYDTTFSHESKYATKNNPFYWRGERLIDKRNGRLIFGPPMRRKGKADGGTVPRTGLPYADRHPYLLADGEEIVSNRLGQADKYRPLLKAINNAADGTTVGGLRNYIRDDLDMKYPKSLRAWDKALERSTKVLDKERDKRQAILDQADGVRSAIGSNYRSDLFTTDTKSPWMSNADRAKSGRGDVFSLLGGDISNLNALQAATGQLTKKGLDGTALAELLSNAPLSTVQAFASGSAADVQRYESLYNQREQRLAQVGSFGANASFGKQLAAANAQVAEAKAANKALKRVERILKDNPKATGDEISKAINKTAPKRR